MNKKISTVIEPGGVLAQSAVVSAVDGYKKTSDIRPRLLIIDDDKIFRMAFIAMARDMGDIIEVDSGEAGLEYLKSNDVDLILLFYGC